MNFNTRNILILVLLAAPLFSYGQTHTLAGKVISFNKFPLNNITIKAKKAKTTTVTDSNGEFEIEVKDKDNLVIQEPGFIAYNQKTSDLISPIEINLFFDYSEKNKSKVTEAGYLSRDDLEYGLEHLITENNVYARYTDIFDAIRFAIPTAAPITENGTRGFMFRGKKTIAGSELALYLLNGVLTQDVTSIAPSEVAHIRKLNNQQAAIYGSRAGNGIIAIETF